MSNIVNICKSINEEVHDQPSNRKEKYTLYLKELSCYLALQPELYFERQQFWHQDYVVIAHPINHWVHG